MKVKKKPQIRWTTLTTYLIGYAIGGAVQLVSDHRGHWSGWILLLIFVGVIAEVGVTHWRHP
jgi:hypothetical protein